ncbi:hypothetical protein WR25_21789 [Diploscapter pachys]|uniref:Uncharacterized protein n=1 Tax=Diploscapter pachys TaxID=2018661 RepID=A0A2A2M2R2_9BILA|nr:hypothetical protein WR25_21789 [Diploscapter pachys]
MACRLAPIARPVSTWRSGTTPGARRQPGHAAEKRDEGAVAGEAQLIGDLAQRHVQRQALDRPQQSPLLAPLLVTHPGVATHQAANGLFTGPGLPRQLAQCWRQAIEAVHQARQASVARQRQQHWLALRALQFGTTQAQQMMIGPMPPIAVEGCLGNPLEQLAQQWIDVEDGHLLR